MRREKGRPPSMEGVGTTREPVSPEEDKASATEGGGGGGGEG